MKERVTMKSSSTSSDTSIVRRAVHWALAEVPGVKLAFQRIDPAKAELALEDARITDVDNESAQQQRRFPVLQKEAADALQMWVADPSYVDARETERAVEMAALQSKMLVTSARLSALKTARATSPAVKELKDAEDAYATACSVARAEREEIHRELVTERLVESLLLSYDEMVREGFVPPPDKRDPAGHIARLFEFATRDRRVIYIAAARFPSLYGEASTS